MKRRYILMGFSLLLLAGAGTGLHAQARDTTGTRSGMPEPMMQDIMLPEMMEMMRACPMTAAMDQGPEAALEHADELALTDDQRRQLEDLKQAEHEAGDILTAEQRTKLRELRHRQAMERMTRMMKMMNMMMQMMDGREEP